MVQHKKRLLEEVNNILDNPLEEGIKSVVMQTFEYWDVVLCGARGTAWEGGEFPLKLEFPEDYAFKCPKVTFLCEMFHPNISIDGVVLGALACDWSPNTDPSTFLQLVRVMLETPVMGCIANEYALTVYLENRELYDTITRENAKQTVIPKVIVQEDVVIKEVKE